MLKQTAAYRIFKKWLKLLSSCLMHKTNKTERIWNAVHKIRGKGYLFGISHYMTYVHFWPCLASTTLETGYFQYTSNL
jgi:hypothetical protein